MTTELPASLVANPWISTWLTVADEGMIGLRIGKVELGQGIVTALTQIAAHELDVPPEAVLAAATNTVSSPDEGLTAGSLSITVSGAAVRRVCAETRELFRRAAARKAGLDIAQVRLASGVFAAPDGSRIGSYADLSGVVDLHVRVGDPSLDVELAPPTSKDLARVDLPDKVLGRARFIHDLDFDGMLHARVVRPPAPGAHLEDVCLAQVASMPGVEDVVRDGDFLAVLARREGQATQAAEAIGGRSVVVGGHRAARLPMTWPGWLRSAEAETSLIRNDAARHDDSSDRGARHLLEAVPCARVDRPQLCHREIRRRTPRRVEPQSRRVHVGPCHCGDPGTASRCGRRAARRGRGQLRPQCRRRRRRGRRAVGDAGSRPVRTGALEPRRRVVLGAVRPGHGRRRQSRRRRERDDHRLVV